MHRLVMLLASVVGLLAACTPAARAQAPAPAVAGAPLQPITRAQTVAIALARGTSTAMGRADTAAARARLISARAVPDSTLGASATKSVPQLHAAFDVPLDVPYVRGLRVGSARAALEASRLRFAYVRAAVRYDVEVAYGQAVAAAERARLSRLSARDAASLLSLARIQVRSGDASEMDAELAAINAGKQANVASADSLAAVTRVCALRTLLGLQSDRPAITLADSLPALVASATDAERALAVIAGPRAPVAGARRKEGEPTAGRPSIDAAPRLRVAAAAATYLSRDLALGLAGRRSALVPSLRVGIERRDPAGGSRSALPVVGASIPLPLFDRFPGAIALATADRDRAGALLDAARRAAERAIARARSELVSSEDRLARDEALLMMARDVATKMLTGYREGALALPVVLPAPRSVREALAWYVTDAVAAANAATAVRLTTATSDTP